MAAGRKPMAHAVQQGPDFVTETPAEQAKLEANARALVRSGTPTPTEALAKQLGYEGPLAPDLLEEGARESLARINFEIFSVGARLLLLKEQCAHGEFVERLERLGVEPRLAQKLMLSTRKFPNAPISAHLANLGKSKIFELVVLDDDEAEAFANGEEVRGITYDDAALMSVSELRAALRKERADKEAEVAEAQAAIAGTLAAKDRLIADSKKRIAELVEEKNRRESMTDSERDAELERDLLEASLLATGATIPLRKAVDAIRAIDHHSQGLYVAMQGALHRVLTEVESIAADYAISLEVGLPAEELEGEFENPNADEDFPASQTIGA